MVTKSTWCFFTSLWGRKETKGERIAHWYTGVCSLAREKLVLLQFFMAHSVVLEYFSINAQTSTYINSSWICVGGR